MTSKRRPGRGEAPPAAEIFREFAWRLADALGMRKQRHKDRSARKRPGTAPNRTSKRASGHAR